ncbi:MAG: DUF4911 domain-containing protein [Candidatus Tenebribacter davisii]|nr:DUF4911 domain-containing protein [Candidatus Tenebribacter davisii]
MKFSVVNKEILLDGTERLMLTVPREELVYLGYILESFEGWCNYTTPNKSESLLQVDVAPDYRDDFIKLINILQNWNYKEE